MTSHMAAPPVMKGSNPRMEPPIHTEDLRSGGGTTLIFMPTELGPCSFDVVRFVRRSHCPCHINGSLAVLEQPRLHGADEHLIDAGFLLQPILQRATLPHDRRVRAAVRQLGAHVHPLLQFCGVASCNGRLEQRKCWLQAAYLLHARHDGIDEVKDSSGYLLLLQVWLFTVESDVPSTTWTHGSGNTKPFAPATLEISRPQRRTTNGCSCTVLGYDVACCVLCVSIVLLTLAMLAGSACLPLRACHDGIDEVEDKSGHVGGLECGEDHLERVLCVRVPNDERKLHG